VGKDEQIDFYDPPEQVERSVAFIDDFDELNAETELALGTRHGMMSRRGAACEDLDDEYAAAAAEARLGKRAFSRSGSTLSVATGCGLGAVVGLGRCFVRADG
jgi:hypothetical protein